jgi:hypothetical protein
VDPARLLCVGGWVGGAGRVVVVIVVRCCLSPPDLQGFLSDSIGPSVSSHQTPLTLATHTLPHTHTRPNQTKPNQGWVLTLAQDHGGDHSHTAPPPSSSSSSSSSQPQPPQPPPADSSTTTSGHGTGLARRALLGGVVRLCLFLGPEAALDHLLPLLSTFFNDTADWCGRMCWLDGRGECDGMPGEGGLLMRRRVCRSHRVM